MSTRSLVSVVVLAFVALCGCGGGLAPVLQIEHGSAYGANGAPLATEQVQQIVYAALLAKQWSVDSSAPGYFIATTRTGDLYATVRIDCGPGVYAIHFAGASPGLRFTGDRIHRRYNNWVDRLDAAIRAELGRAVSMGYAAAPPVQAPPEAPPPIVGPSIVPVGKPPPPPPPS